MQNLPRLLLLAGLAGLTTACTEAPSGNKPDAAKVDATAPAVDSPKAKVDAPVAPAVAVSKPTIGADAPEFKPTEWVQGEPVTAFEKGKVYIIECWATWCGPCVAQIPHLNGLHKKYADKGLVVIGTNVWDKDKANVEAFLKKKGDAMSYRVAFDDQKTGLVTRDWLKAAGVRGIPHAFVVRDGKIIFAGHPAGLSEKVVEAMLAGTYDTAMAAAEQKANEEKSAKIQGIQKEMAALIKEKKYNEALGKTDELEALLGARVKPQMDYQRALITAHVNVTEGVAKMAKIVADNAKERGAMSQIGRTLLNPPFKGDKGAANLALECATKLRELAPGAQAESLYKQAAAAAGVEEAKPAAAEASKTAAL